LRLAQSRTADGITVPVAASHASGDGHWFDLRQLTTHIGPQTLAADSLAGIRAAIDAGRLPQVAAPSQFAPPLARIGKIVPQPVHDAVHGLGRQRQTFRAA
jgi:hypothetical protein